MSQQFSVKLRAPLSHEKFSKISMDMAREVVFFPDNS